MGAVPTHIWSVLAFVLMVPNDTTAPATSRMSRVVADASHMVEAAAAKSQDTVSLSRIAAADASHTAVVLAANQKPARHTPSLRGLGSDTVA